MMTLYANEKEVKISSDKLNFTQLLDDMITKVILNDISGYFITHEYYLSILSMNNDNNFYSAEVDRLQERIDLLNQKYIIKHDRTILIRNIAIITSIVFLLIIGVLSCVLGLNLYYSIRL